MMKGASKKATPLLDLETEPSFEKSSVKDSIIMIYGAPGVGKTTFVKKLMPRVFFISTDRGTKGMKTMREDCDSYEKLMSILATLEAKADKLKYDMVCMDHVDDITQMIEMHVCDELGVESLSDAKWGKGWKAYKSAIHQVVLRLKALGLGVVFIAHEQFKAVKIRGIEMDKVMPDMSKSAWKVIIPLAEIVGYIAARTIKIGGKREDVRVLHTQPLDGLYAKDRTTRRKPTKEYEILNPSKFVESFSNKEPTNV